MRQLLSFAAIVITLFSCVCGCGDGRLPLGEISGNVTLDGKPLAKGQVEFIGAKRRAYGAVEEGKIVEVTTYEVGDGVPVGMHQVAIRPKIDESLLMSPKGAAAFSSGKSVPKKYHRVGTSGLSVEVVSGENKVSFELSSKE